MNTCRGGGIYVRIILIAYKYNKLLLPFSFIINNILLIIYS